MNSSSSPDGNVLPFEFAADPGYVADQVAACDVVVRIPKDIARRRTLLRCFASPLCFPGYFGWNWDAFRECLFDLSWLTPPPARIVVVHEDVPFVAKPHDLAIYLSVLSEWANSSHNLPIRVVFPVNQRDTIRQQWTSSSDGVELPSEN